MSRMTRKSKVGGGIGGLGKRKKAEKDQKEKEEINAVDMGALAPKEIPRGMLSTLLKTEQSKLSEVKLSIMIKEFKLDNKKVAAAEVITIHEGNKTNMSIPFKKPLEFKFNKVENEMVFKFAVTGSGDLLGFIYLEIPQKFRTMKSFKLDDWFPIKQIVPDEEDEIVRVQNFMARIIVSYKATRKLELTDYFPQNIPKAKVFQLMAKNLKSRLNNINKDMKNFNEDGFKYLHDFEKRILRRRMDLHKQHLSPVRHKNLRAKEYLNQQEQVYIKGKGVAAKNELVVGAETRFDDYYNKQGGKYKMKRGANTQRAVEELMKELTVTKKELADKNQRLRALEEAQMEPENIDLKRQIEQMRDDLQGDKKELTINMVEANKELATERDAKKQEHDAEMEECRDLKTQIDDVMDRYKQKYRELQELENGLKLKTDENDKLAEKARLKENETDKERNKLDNEKETLEELENDLDKLKEKMMLERMKIHKDTQSFGDDRGDIGIKERQLNMQRTFLNNQREDFEKEKSDGYKELALLAREIDEIKKLGGLDYEQQAMMEEEYKERNDEVDAGHKKNKMEGVRIWKE